MKVSYLCNTVLFFLPCRRKEEILTPELYDCALTGDGERLFRVLEDGDNVNLKVQIIGLTEYLVLHILETLYDT